jgi:hypothetical protein
MRNVRKSYKISFLIASKNIVFERNNNNFIITKIKVLLKKTNTHHTRWRLHSSSYFTFYSVFCLFGGVYRHFQQYFSYVVAVSFIGEGNRSTRAKPPLCHKLLTNLITYCCIEYTLLISDIVRHSRCA